MRYIFFLAFLFTGLEGFCQGHSLNYFIGHSINNSPLIKDYNNQVISNQLDSILLRASLKTQVNFISNNLYAPVIKGFGYDNAITNGANISAVVQASRTFLTKNNIAAQLSAIRLQSQSFLDTIKITEQDVIRTVTEQYITAYGDQITMDFNREVYDLLKKRRGNFKETYPAKHLQANGLPGVLCYHATAAVCLYAIADTVQY